MILLSALLIIVLTLLLLQGLTPLAGKLGRLQSIISASTVNHQFQDWQLDLNAEMIEVDGFEKTPDSDSNYWHSYLAGLCGGEAHFQGKWNSAITPTTSFRPGFSNYTSLFCGLTTSIGLTLAGKCKSIGPSTDVSKVGMFKGVFQVEGVTTYPS